MPPQSQVLKKIQEVQEHLEAENLLILQVQTFQMELSSRVESELHYTSAGR
jgi:hypothetical protein